MQALVFDTKIFHDGIIKIPELSTWENSEVSIIVLKKPTHKNPDQNANLLKQDYDGEKVIAEFNRVRAMRTGKAEMLTMDKAIDIYDELTSIS